MTMSGDSTRSNEARTRMDFVPSALSRWLASQEGIVLILTALMFLIFAFVFKGFLTWTNIGNLLLNVSLLGILALGMGIVVIGRGIDLSMLTIAIASSAWCVHLIELKYSLFIAIGAGFILAIFIGVINGLLIAFAEIPALFATIATSLAFLGIAKVFLVETDVTFLPASVTPMYFLAQGRLFNIPFPIIVCVLLAIVALSVLRNLVYGRFLYALGDNFEAARVSGVPVRPMIVVNYVVSAVFGFVGGLILASASAGVNFEYTSSSTIIFDASLSAKGCQ